MSPVYGEKQCPGLGLRLRAQKFRAAFQLARIVAVHWAFASTQPPTLDCAATLRYDGVLLCSVGCCLQLSTVPLPQLPSTFAVAGGTRHCFGEILDCCQVLQNLRLAPEAFSWGDALQDCGTAGQGTEQKAWVAERSALKA